MAVQFSQSMRRRALLPALAGVPRLGVSSTLWTGERCEITRILPHFEKTMEVTGEKAEKCERKGHPGPSARSASIRAVRQ